MDYKWTHHLGSLLSLRGLHMKKQALRLPAARN